MDLRRPRVCRHSNVGLVAIVILISDISHLGEVTSFIFLSSVMLSASVPILSSSWPRKLYPGTLSSFHWSTLGYILSGYVFGLLAQLGSSCWFLWFIFETSIPVLNLDILHCIIFLVVFFPYTGSSGSSWFLMSSQCVVLDLILPIKP